MQPWTVVACNTATTSSNLIHDDGVARRFGFRGGLVPGVDVYAYLTHPPVARWGIDWLRSGTMHARFHAPVYDGDVVTVVPVGDAGLEARDPSGAPRAAATVGPPRSTAAATDRVRWPDVAQRNDDVPPATPETLAPGTTLGLAAHRFDAARAVEYLAEIGETLPLYADEGIAHPGWLLRDANHVLSRNVRLGPWIHVESSVTHHGVVRDGEEVSARAVVAREWEHKGHRFVALDVVHLANGRVVAQTDHVAIYQPRSSSTIGASQSVNPTLRPAPAGPDA